MTQPITEEELRSLCAIDGDWGGTDWGDTILHLLEDRDAWRDQIVMIRAQQRAALRERDDARQLLRDAHTYCARPEGVCLPIDAGLEKRA